MKKGNMAESCRLQSAKLLPMLLLPPCTIAKVFRMGDSARILLPAIPMVQDTPVRDRHSPGMIGNTKDRSVGYRRNAR